MNPYSKNLAYKNLYIFKDSVWNLFKINIVIVIIMKKSYSKNIHVIDFCGILFDTFNNCINIELNKTWIILTAKKYIYMIYIHIKNYVC